MHYLQQFIVLANCFFLITGTAKNSTVHLKDNPVSVLERNFSRSLYQRLALERGNGNLLVSPLGVDVLLATLLEGAQGEDRVNLTRLLGLDRVAGFPYSEIKIGYQQMLKNLTSQLQMSTRLFVDNDFDVNKDFQSTANDYYQTGVESLNVTNKEEAAKAINSYVEGNTNHKIRGVFSEGDLSDNSTMICLSTLHFHDQWALLFPKQITSKQPFRPSPKTHSLVHMMHAKNKFHFVWNLTLQAKLLSLDFITTNVSMIFILPDIEDELLELEARLATEDCTPLLNQVRSTPPVNVDLWMPRFTLRENLDLGKTLKQMGLTSLFTPDADLSGISSHAGLHVSKMIQKAHLVVGENGIETSSTEVVEANNGVKEENWHQFHADHPFIFFVVMDELVVFQGRLVDP